MPAQCYVCRRKKVVDNGDIAQHQRPCVCDKKPVGNGLSRIDLGVSVAVVQGGDFIQRERARLAPLNDHLARPAMSIRTAASTDAREIVRVARIACCFPVTVYNDAACYPAGQMA